MCLVQPTGMMKSTFSNLLRQMFLLHCKRKSFKGVPFINLMDCKIKANTTYL